MIRTIEVVAWYDIPDDDKNITTPQCAEEITYNDVIQTFDDDEYFQGLRVDVKDYNTNESKEEIKNILQKYVG